MQVFSLFAFTSAEVGASSSDTSTLLSTFAKEETSGRMPILSRKGEVVSIFIVCFVVIPQK